MSERPDAMALATAERQDLADLLATLTDDQWEVESLCEGWSVRDVVAHVISYEGLNPLQLVPRLVQARMDPARLNALSLEALADVEPADLVARVREHARPKGLTAALGGRVGLTDSLIHHQDIRRPLGLRREVPADRLRVALGTAVIAPPLPSRKKVRGLTLVASDVDWSSGEGPAVSGAGEALLLAIAGRRAALEDLEGPGLDLWRERLDG